MTQPKGLSRGSPEKRSKQKSPVKRSRLQENMFGNVSADTLKEGETVLSRLRRRSLPAHPDMRHDLNEVVLQRRWSEVGGGIDERLDRISQVNLSAERNRPLKRRFLFAVAIVGAIYTFLVRSSLRAQYVQWEEKPDRMIGLTGIDGSYVIPLLFSFWYLVLCWLFSRLMANSQPVETLIFEVMVMYNVLQACMSFYIAVIILQEVRLLGLGFVGNAWPSYRPEDRGLAITAVLHYHLRILELLDTFFLILRKKIGSSSSLHLHVLLRLQNVWGWHVACRFGCGGDIYFPLVTNAVCSIILHMHYAWTLLEPRARQVTGLFRSWPSEEHHIKRRSAIMAVQVWSFRLCLCYGLLSFFAGSYPRFVLIVNIVQCAFGVLLYSNFHYKPSPRPGQDVPEEDPDAHPAKLTFSFDSSGWCYFYHWGVGMWLQEHLKDEIERGELAWSGSSGGAIVACGLAQGLDIPAVLDSVIHRTHDRAGKKPWLLPEEVQYTLETFVPENGHEIASNRLRVLMTRLMWKPPFVMAEVVSEFRSRSYLFEVLQASSHIPVVFGLGKLLDGVRYFDGMFWIGSIVPWRTFNSKQTVCRVSAFSQFGSDIGPRWFAIPPIWWAVFPPSREVLEGMTWAGYRDIAAAFGSADGRASGCGTCSKRQSISHVPTSCSRQVSSERVDELILLYERRAQRDWTILFASIITFTVCCWLAWLTSISLNR